MSDETPTGPAEWRALAALVPTELCFGCLTEAEARRYSEALLAAAERCERVEGERDAERQRADALAAEQQKRCLECDRYHREEARRVVAAERAQADALAAKVEACEGVLEQEFMRGSAGRNEYEQGELVMARRFATVLKAGENK